MNINKAIADGDLAWRSSKTGSNRMDKKATERRHFMKQYNRRIGIECSIETYNSIVKEVKNGNMLKIVDQSCRVEAYEYVFNSISYVVLYDKKRSSLITLLFLTDQFLEDNNVIRKEGRYIQRDSTPRKIRNGHIPTPPGTIREVKL